MNIPSSFGRLSGRRLAPASALALLAIIWAANVQAAEQRCTDLDATAGASCICSEPLNTTTFGGTQPQFNPADSTTKECSAEGVAGAAVTRNSPVTGSNDTTALNALPPGNKVSNFVRPAQNDHQNLFFVGHGVPVSASFVRLAARWYIWHTPTFDFANEATCNNSKIAEFDNDSRVDYLGQFHTYNYLQFTPKVDCCVTGPGPNSGIPSGQMKGKWWRFEIVMTNRSGPAYDLKMYGRNVTDNGPELLIIDLSRNSSVNNLTPPSLMSKILSNNHRFSASGTCRGWLGISHYMMAGWTTNAGQRIGAAVEVEPGAVAPPTGIKVGALTEE